MASGLAQSNTNHYIMRIRLILPHNLQLIVWRPPHLRKAQAPFHALQVLSSNLVAEDMRLLVALVQLLS